MDRESYHTLYLDEVQHELKGIETIIGGLEDGVPGLRSHIDGLFRHVHTIKSSSQAMGHLLLVGVLHDIETALEHIRQRNVSIDRAFIELILLSVERIRGALPDMAGVGTQVMNDLRVLWQKHLRGESVDERRAEILLPAVTEDVRISASHLERMMGVSEDLLQARMHLEELGATLFRSSGDGTSVGGAMMRTEYQSTTRQLHRLTAELEFMLRESRMITLQRIFDGLPRAVKDIAATLEKDVALHISGGDIHVDRTIIEHLGGPLLHLVRNAIDHGIDKQGKLRVDAKHVSDSITITVEDDGRGILYENILSVARAKGIIPQAHALSQDEIKDLMFHPHLSTTTIPNMISGRGVGLFSVKEYARSVGGRVSVESPLADGKGTRFSLTLPISLALVRVLLIRSGHAFFGIPISYVSHTTVFDSKDVFRENGKEMMRIAQETIPLLRLSMLLGLNIGGVVLTNDPTMVVVTRTEQDNIAILVDHVVREEEVVVRPLPHLLLSLKGFSGAMTLGDGRTILMIDPAGLLAIPIESEVTLQEAPSLSSDEQDQLREVMNVVASHAGGAIARRIGLPVELSVPEYADGELSLPESDWGATAVGVRITLLGAYPGHLLLEMPESMARAIADKILEREIQLHELKNEDRAFFQELGTIAMHAVGNILSRVSKNPVMTSSPDLRVDARGALRTHFLSDHDAPRDLVRVRLWFAFGDHVKTDAHDQAGSITMEFKRRDARALFAAMRTASTNK